MTEPAQPAPSPQSRIAVERDPAGDVVVSVIGDLQSDVAVALSNCIDEEALTSPGVVTVDLGDVGLIDAAGVATLADAAALADDRGIGFGLVGVRTGRVHKVLAFAGLTDLITTVDSAGSTESRPSPVTRWNRRRVVPFTRQDREASCRGRRHLGYTVSTLWSGSLADSTLITTDYVVRRQTSTSPRRPS